MNWASFKPSCCQFQHIGKNVNRSGLNHIGPNLNRVGPDLNRVGSNLNRVSSYSNWVAHNLNHTGPNFNQSLTYLNWVGPNFSWVWCPSNWGERNLIHIRPYLNQIRPYSDGAGPNLNLWAQLKHIGPKWKHHAQFKWNWTQFKLSFPILTTSGPTLSLLDPIWIIRPHLNQAGPNLNHRAQLEYKAQFQSNWLNIWVFWIWNNFQNSPAFYGSALNRK